MIEQGVLAGVVEPLEQQPLADHQFQAGLDRQPQATGRGRRDHAGHGLRPAPAGGDLDHATTPAPLLARFDHLGQRPGAVERRLARASAAQHDAAGADAKHLVQREPARWQPDHAAATRCLVQRRLDLAVDHLDRRLAAGQRSASAVVTGPGEVGQVAYPRQFLRQRQRREGDQQQADEEARAQLVRQDRADVGRLAEQAQAHTRDPIIEHVTQPAWHESQRSADQAPDAAETRERDHDAGRAGVDLSVLIEQQQAVRQVVLQFERHPLPEGLAVERRVMKRAGRVLGQQEADGLVAQSAAAVVEQHLLRLRLAGGDPGRDEGEQVQHDHAQAEVGEVDQDDQPAVHAQHRQPDPAAQRPKQRQRCEG